MTIFMTKVWGFGVPCGPLQFSTNGWRENALTELREGDWVVVVGTQDEPTDPDEQGRLLGIMEPTREPVSSLDFPLEIRDVDYNDEGNYRWPFALHNRRAWILDERPLLSEVSDRHFDMDAVLGIVPLTEQEAASVLDLNRTEVDLLTSARAIARIEGDEVARRHAASPPTTRRSGVMHLRKAPAYTYCMQLVGAEKNSHKIGWAFDFQNRQRRFNRSSMPTLGGIEYETKMTELWDTAREAYRMEQAILDKFSESVHACNHEIIVGVQFSEIQNSWIEILQRLRR